MLPGHQVWPVLPAHRVTLDQQDCQDPRVLLELLESRDLQASPDQLALLEQLVLMEPLERPGGLELAEHRETLDSLELSEAPAPLGPPEARDLLVPQDRLVLLD